MTVNITPSLEKVSERIYSNFVQINYSPHDITLTFCDILPITADEKLKIVKTQKLDAPIQAEIVIPHSLVEPLMRALSESYEKHKKTIESARIIKESKSK